MRMRARTGHRAYSQPEAAKGEEQEACAERGTEEARERSKAETKKVQNVPGGLWAASGRPGSTDINFFVRKKLHGRGLGPSWDEKLIGFRPPGGPREPAGGEALGGHFGGHFGSRGLVAPKK